MNLKVIVFLIIFAKISIAVSLSNDWNCSNTTSCTSVLHKSYIKITCLQLSISIYWNGWSFEESPSININCLDLDEYFLGDIPICQYRNSSIEQFNHVRIRGCPLPADKSIKSSFKIFENSSVNILEWYSRTDLNRQHFNGLENLDELILKENELSNLPEGLFDDLTNLKILDLSSNKLNLTKNIFAKLKNLQKLRLGQNYLKVLEKGVFRNQYMLDSLELWSNNLKNLTKESFEGLSSLQYLDLSSNYIERFQSDIFSTLVNLTVLKINENMFKSLPDKLFENNKRLYTFNMRENHFPLDTLPAGFLSNLTDLTVVQISCGLTHISEDLFKGSINLLDVALDHNNLTTIPVKLFADQLNLFNLNLQHNQLKYLPSGLLADTSNLKYLILSNNQLENISGVLFNSLENSTVNKDVQIDMSFNKIKKLSTRFLAEFVNQESLDLSNNEIVEIDFTEVEDFIPMKTFNLLSVYLNNNPIYCNCDILHFIKYIRKDLILNTDKFFEIFPENMKCAGPENMHGKLIVDVRPTDLLCPLEENCPNKCSCMVRPADQTLLVNCSNSNLHEVPNLPDLLLDKFESTELNISHNHIRDLPIINSTNVKKIYAQNNLITKISIENIPDQLGVIDLSNNNLEKIHLTVLQKFNKTLQFLRLSGNSWKCDCETLRFSLFLQQNIEIIKDLDEIQCSNGKTIFKMTKKDLCFIDPILFVSIITLAVFIIIGVLISIFLIYQIEIKIWFFEHNICVKEVVDDLRRFDAYILYSNIDDDFVINDLVPKLKNGSNPFKLCLSERNWVLNEVVSTQCVNESRKTIIILSINFLKTIWNRTDFRIAYQEAKLIFILFGDIGSIHDLDDELKACLRKNTYIKWGEPLFWKKLRYAMPHIRRPANDNVVDELELEEIN